LTFTMSCTFAIRLTPSPYRLVPVPDRKATVAVAT
jgi:hypothetical protein